ncbi:MAG: phage terminase small subunit P27 family [Gammaproteobacteria bacterium]|nr:MAG: phage terminase small subunit P27 family [Gammaproteobacteria bacterium]
MKPKPPELRAGHPRKAARPKPVEAFNPDQLTAPEHLNERARRIFTDLVRLGAGVYGPSDVPVLERYAAMQDRRISLMEVIEDQGLMSVGSTGQPTLHPAAKALQDIESRLLPLEDRLFLNPEARIRMNVFATESRTKLKRFLEDDD